MSDNDTSLTPLITAAEIFPALEMLVAEAQEELLFAFRVLDPQTKLRAHELRERGFETWGDLVADASARGVKIRMLLADFDAVFASDMHRAAWKNAKGFAARLSGDADVVCTPHGHQAGDMWKWMFRGKIRRKLKEMRADPEETLTDVQRDMLRNGPSLRPVTLHQKFLVADRKRAVLGGLDVDERRWDDPDHRRDPSDTWHDVSLSVAGPICEDIRSHFIHCWNEAVESRSPSIMNGGQPLPRDSQTPPQDMPRLVRTMSKPRDGLVRLGPEPWITEHEDSLKDAFARARDHIYLETQFFRHQPIADALASAGRAVPDLQLILLVPTAPERIVFDGDDGFAARQEQAMQVRCIDTCRKAFGDRMVVVSPARAKSADSDERGRLRGAEIVYVHAKVALIDDAWGMVGSANLNGRSMRWDTEASIAFNDSATVRHLRKRLANLWLRDFVELGDTAKAATWAEAGKRNAALPPEERHGFVLPYPMKANRKFSSRVQVLPQEFF